MAPNIRYINQSAPFWDWIASFEDQAGEHPFFNGPRGPPPHGHPAGPPPHGHPAGPPPHGHPAGSSPPPAGPWGWAPWGRHHRHHNWHGDLPTHGRNGEEGEASGSDNQQAEGDEKRAAGNENEDPIPDPPEDTPEPPREGRPCGRGGRRGGGCRGRREGFEGRHHRGFGGHHHPYGRWGFGGRHAFAGLSDMFQPAEQGDWKPEADVFDTEPAYIVHLSLPGAHKEDIGVNWDPEKSELSVAGVVHRPGDEAFLKTLALDERRAGAFERKVRLGTRASPAQVDVDGITAKLENGILFIEVPKLNGEFVEIKKVDIE